MNVDRRIMNALIVKMECDTVTMIGYISQLDRCVVNMCCAVENMSGNKEIILPAIKF